MRQDPHSRGYCDSYNTRTSKKLPTKDFLISCLSKEQFAPNGSFDKGSINFLAELLVSFIQKVKKGQVFLVVVLDGKNHETIERLPPY